MDVISFDSSEEMDDFLRRNARAASDSLHPMQRALTFGDHWVHFVDVPARDVEFGRVHTTDEIRQGARANGATGAEADAEVEMTIGQITEDNLMYGTAYINWQPAGELGYTHKASVWPIEERLFEMAKAADWQIDRLTETGQMLLQIAYAAIQAHQMRVV